MRCNHSESGFTIVHAIAVIASLLAVILFVLLVTGPKKSKLDFVPDVPQAQTNAKEANKDDWAERLLTEPLKEVPEKDNTARLRDIASLLDQEFPKVPVQLTAAQKRAIRLEELIDETCLKIEQPLSFIRKFSLDLVVNDAVEKCITKGELMDKCELVLRRNGIQLDPTAEHRLQISCNGMWDNTETTLTFTFNVQVRQNSFIFRYGTPYKCFSTIWQDGSFGYAGKERAKSFINEGLPDLIDRFALAYLKANSKTTP